MVVWEGECGQWGGVVQRAGGARLRIWVRVGLERGERERSGSRVLDCRGRRRVGQAHLGKLALGRVHGVDGDRGMEGLERRSGKRGDEGGGVWGVGTQHVLILIGWMVRGVG